MNDMEAIARLVNALRPWRDRLVLVGGWAHRLHRFHELAGPVRYLPVMTRDADVAIPDGPVGEGDIGEALRLAGFTEDLHGLPAARGQVPPGARRRGVLRRVPGTPARQRSAPGRCGTTRCAAP